jgi:hypothetical protein
MQMSTISLELYADVSTPESIKEVRVEYDQSAPRLVISSPPSGHFLTQIPPFIIYVGFIGTPN